jgi:catechol 2,3-dioxygenase-like lactoylglutathione lyase family enzyme
MFQHNGAFSSYSVHDTEKARAFYEDILGLKVVVKEYIMELHVGGAGSILLYPKDNHEPATFTVLNFKVGNIEEAVKTLKGKGVTFESYDLPGIKTDANNIFSVKEMSMRQAWFKDPSGNILSVIEE